MKHFLFILILLTGSLARADSLSLDEALKEAQSGSLEIQADAAHQDELDWGVTEARAPFLPTFEFDADHFFNIRYQTYTFTLPGNQPLTFPFVTPSTTYTLNGRWNIFNGFVDHNKVASAKLKKEAADRDLAWTRYQVDQSIRLNFFQVIAARQLEEVAITNVSNLEQHLKEVTDLLKAGEAIEVDVLRVQVQLNNARAEKINASDNVVISQQHLAQAMGKHIESRIPGGSLPIPDPALADRIESTSREENLFNGRADLQARDLRTHAAEKTHDAAANYWIPTLSLIGNYQWYNNVNYDVVTPPTFRSAWQYGVELKWNIFDGLLSHAKSREDAAKAVRDAKQDQLVRLQASTDIRSSSSDYRYALSQYLANTDNLERSKKSVQLALTALRYGAQTNTDVLDAELDLFNARAGVIQSQIKALEAQIKFETAIGRNI